MKVGIMQPYFLPYLGYWQLMGAVDKYVIYDNIQFEKSGWIRRNRFLGQDGTPQMFTVPLKKDSDYLNINERYLADDREIHIRKILNRISASYRKAPYFTETYEIAKDCFQCPEKNLFRYVYYSIERIREILGIETEIMVSSELDIDHALKNEKKIIAICKALNADVYINPIGGTKLYRADSFQKEKIDLRFLESALPSYKQFANAFVPALSVLDILMFNSKDEAIGFLNKYKIIRGAL